MRYLVLLLALAGCAATAPAPQSCTLVENADLPIHFMGNSPVIDVTIAGHTLHMLLDTGAQTSLLTPAAAKTVPAKAFNAGIYGLDGVGGSVSTMTVSTPDLKFGELTVTNASFSITNLFGKAKGHPADLDGVIGWNILSRLDLVLDFPDDHVMFLTPGTCASVPWNGTYAELGFPPYSAQVPIGIKIDGKPLTVLLDTGASLSLISQNALKGAGITPVEVETSSHYVGFGDLKGAQTREVFSNVTVGDVAYANVPLEVGAPNSFSDDDNNISGVLGEDFLRLNRIFIDNGANVVRIMDPAPAS